MAWWDLVALAEVFRDWYSNRARGEGRKAAGAAPAAEVEVHVSTPRSRSWARLMRRIFEVDPLLCPQCRVEMRIVSVIQEFAVVDRLLAHFRRIGGNDPHEGTAQRGRRVGRARHRT